MIDLGRIFGKVESGLLVAGGFRWGHGDILEMHDGNLDSMGLIRCERTAAAHRYRRLNWLGMLRYCRKERQ